MGEEFRKCPQSSHKQPRRLMTTRRKPPSVADARTLLGRYDFVSEVYERRYLWLVERFIPCVKVLASSRRWGDRRRAAKGYYLLGDVHDLNDAPRAALRAYRRCLKLDPDDAAAWREIGEMLFAMGDYQKAKNACRRALALAPSDVLVPRPASLDEQITRRPAPLYKPGDPFWEASELLAKSFPKKALNLLQRKRSIRARQLRARAHGAMGQPHAVMRQWTAIANMDGPVRTESADWFFLPDEIWDAPRFWETMLRLAHGNRMRGDSCWNYHGSLWKIFFQRERRVLRAGRFSSQEIVLLHLHYHLARTNKDLATISTLSSLYPRWTEAAQLRRALRSEGISN